MCQYKMHTLASSDGNGNMGNGEDHKAIFHTFCTRRPRQTDGEGRFSVNRILLFILCISKWQQSMMNNQLESDPHPRF